MNTNQVRQTNSSPDQSSTWTTNQDQYRCTTDLSRRSIDWRDSGIVIDEDNHLFHSFENSRDLDSHSSIISDHGCQHSSSQQPHSPIETIAKCQDEDGDTILHLAVVSLSLKKAEDLVCLCDLNAINNMMQTPLHVATLANRPEMVRLLISSGAKMGVHDRRGNTPLHLACQKGFKEIVEIILDALPKDVSDENQEQAIRLCNFEGFACLHLAAMSNQIEIIELLVDKYHADLSARDSKSGETILHKAIRNSNINLVHFILKHNQHDLISAADYSGRMPLDTIEIMLESATGHRDQNLQFLKLKQMIEESVHECEARGGCCVGRNRAASRSANLSDSASSSSDYSDTD
jgi:ankyrin repeat protein